MPIGLVGIVGVTTRAQAELEVEPAALIRSSFKLSEFAET